MRLAIISDQHGSLPKIPECDLLIVSGDITGANPHGPRDNSDDHWRRWFDNDWMTWRAGIPTVVIGGNHDTCFEFLRPEDNYNFRYLCDSGCEFKGLRFWGAPWIRKWDTLAFNISDEDMEIRFAMVPPGTDIVLCHMPPLGYGDLLEAKTTHHVGSAAITRMIERVRPRLVTCGHVHLGRGTYSLGSTKIINSACEFTTEILA